MRVFVTGASGHIGSALVTELVQAGHEVVGLARSDNSAATVKALGAEVHRGDSADLAGLRTAAADSDAVIHLAFDHEVMRTDFAGAANADLAVARSFGEALAGTGKTFIGIGIKHTGIEAVDAAIDANPRSVVAREIETFADRGIRSMLVAVPPVTHSSNDKHGFIPTLIGIARETGVSAYVDEGANRWPAAHTLDVAHLFRLALEQAPAGAQLFAATENGITVREIAETIGRHLGIPAKSITADEAAEHFATFPFITMNIPMDNTGTRELLDWRPEHPGLIADLDEGHYFAAK
ncbi:MAG TPA: SDR family oxidoreductase [Pseudonocardiaceae bacterium]|jgi:nucleoside-diphosphate-sugar epimerase|nr:SDR family oxidoreductase [Pseudonocardiaceae bacterium]